MTSLAEELPKQQARCRGLIEIYNEIGPVGIFAKTMIEQALQRADGAVMSGDIVAMIQSLQELKGFSD